MDFSQKRVPGDAKNTRMAKKVVFWTIKNWSKFLDGKKRPKNDRDCTLDAPSGGSGSAARHNVRGQREGKGG